MSKSGWVVAKMNLRNIKVPFFVSGLLTLYGLGQTVAMYIIVSGGVGLVRSGEISGGCYLWLLPLLAGIIIPAKNFRRIVNLGGSRNIFLQGAVLTYGILAVMTSLLNTILNYTFDRAPVSTAYFEEGSFGGIINIMEVFGWTEHGLVLAFLQQAAFLFLLAVFAHTLTALQDKWYGWAADVLLIAIISVFTPIEPLRNALAGFFHLIFFAEALPQIAACLLISAALCLSGRPIFARKMI